MATKREQLGELSYDFIRRFVLKTRVVCPRAYGDKKEYVQGLARQLTKPECGFLACRFHAGRSAEATAETFSWRFRPDDELIRTELLRWIANQHSDADILEEVPVDECRADLVVVDERTTASEIKSPRDSFIGSTHSYRPIQPPSITSCWPFRPRWHCQRPFSPT